ncbi:MAG: hypothetical protein WC343_02870 [Bacilli bacterium]|jgi:hypothetical protein
MLEVGNYCYINNDYSRLWLITRITNGNVELKNIRDENYLICSKSNITEIIEN